jgi:hypothetical protein
MISGPIPSPCATVMGVFRLIEVEGKGYQSKSMATDEHR